MLKRHLLIWPLAGSLAGLLLGAFDAVTLAANAQEMFFDTTELVRTVFWSLAICATTGLFTGTLVSLLTGMISKIRTLPWFNKKYGFELILTLMVLPILIILLFKLTNGPRASQIPGRFVWIGLASLLLSSSTGFFSGYLLKQSTQSTIGQIIVGAFCMTIALGLTIIDATVLLRLYAVFHQGLSIAALTVGTLGGYLFVSLFSSLSRGKWLGTVLVGLILGGTLTVGALSIHKLFQTQNARFVISEKTVHTSDVVNAFTAKLFSTANVQGNEAILEDPLQQNEPVKTAISLRGKPVVLLTVDAMRFDRIKTDGTPNTIVPNLQKLANKSVYFNRAYTATPHTSYAVTSLLTGKYIAPLFEIPGVPEVHETWPQILARFRYETAAFFTKAVVFIDRPRFEPYLDKGFGFKKVNMEYKLSAATRITQTINFIESLPNKNTPFFTWTHFFEAHEPYDKNCTRFGKSDEQRYNCELSVVDKAIGQFINYLDKNHPDAIIIVAADHGEEFGDHGGKYHGTTLYDEQIRVPLFFKVPQIAPKVIHAPVSLVDLLGTTLSLLNIPKPARVRSRDLTGLMTGEKETPHKQVAFCEVHHQKMVTTQTHKLVVNKQANIHVLYDLVNDPDERKSVASQNPNLVKTLANQIKAFEQSHALTELRPVVENNQTDAWPKAIQKTLGGDTSTLEELTEFIGTDYPTAVRQKAASLIFQLWADRSTEPLDALPPDDEPAVNGWIELTLLAHDSQRSLASLTSIYGALKPNTTIWNQTAMVLFAKAPKKYSQDLIDILSNSDAALETRLKAITLLGEANISKAVPQLIKHINNYQLSQQVVWALGKLNRKSTIPALITRLKRERFADRRQTVATALGAFSNKEVIAPIAHELTRKPPVSNVLKLLLSKKAASPKGHKINVSPNGQTVIVLSPKKNTPMRYISKSPKETQITRLFIQKAKDATFEIKITCNDQPSKTVQLLTNVETSFFPIDDCQSQNNQLEITISQKPTDSPDTILGAALVEQPPASFSI